MKTILNLKNRNGLTMIECMIALVLTTTAVVSLITMQTMAWRGAGKSDYLGRAVGLLQRELETRESDIMWSLINPPVNNNAIPSCTDATGSNVLCTSSSRVFRIIYTPTGVIPPAIPAIGSGTIYHFNVQITWPGTINGIRSSMMVSR